MEHLNEILDELYLNYDTVHEMLNENFSKDEILDMFREDIEYSDDLTESLLKLKKSYLKSVVLRIKMKMRKNKPKEIKTDLLKYNESLEPLLNKILASPKFEKSYNETIKDIKKETRIEKPKPKPKPKPVVEEVQEAEEEETPVEEEETPVEEEACEEEIHEEDDINSILDAPNEDEEEEDEFHFEEYFHEYIEKTKNSKDKVTIEDAFECYQEFYEDHSSYPEATQSELKEYLDSKCGKYHKKKGYVGYKLTDFESE